jgi:glutamate synthase (NADPH/NADH) large chain
MLLEDILETFSNEYAVLSMSAPLDQSIEIALTKIQQVAIEAVMKGAGCLILDDTAALDGQQVWIDPLLAVAAVDKALRQHDHRYNLRRQVGIISAKARDRDLHDLAMCLSLGANAVFPYFLYTVGLGLAPRPSKTPPTLEEIMSGLNLMVSILTKGLEKVTSTIGCHELRGYGHSFSSIGLSSSVASVFGTPNYFGSEGRGLTWDAINDDVDARASELRGEAKNRLEEP